MICVRPEVRALYPLESSELTCFSAEWYPPRKSSKSNAGTNLDLRRNPRKCRKTKDVDAAGQTACKDECRKHETFFRRVSVYLTLVRGVRGGARNDTVIVTKRSCENLSTKRSPGLSALGQPVHRAGIPLALINRSRPLLSVTCKRKMFGSDVAYCNSVAGVACAFVRDRNECDRPAIRREDNRESIDSLKQPRPERERAVLSLAQSRITE
jgi:hypothetical protein